MRLDVLIVDLHSLVVAIIAAQVCRASAPLAVLIEWQAMRLPYKLFVFDSCARKVNP